MFNSNNVIAMVLGVAFAAIVFLGMQFGYIGEDISLLGSTVATIIGLAIFLMVYFSVEQFVGNLEASRRYNKIEANQTAKAQSMAAQTRLRRKFEEAYKKEHPLVALFTTAAQKIFRTQGGRAQDLRMKLMAAGYLNEKAVTTYLALRSIMPVVFMVAALIAGPLYFDLSPTETGMAMAVAAVAGWYGVELVVNSKITARRQKISSQLPDVIDLLTIYTESGITFDVGMRKVLEVLRKRAPQAVGELSIFDRELQMLPDRGKAYDNLLKRAECTIIKAFIAILRQHDQVGSPISASLRQLGKEARREALQLIEKKAAKIPILINLPVMLFILPALLMVVIGPTVVTVMNMTVFGK